MNLDWRRLKAVVLESDDWGLCAWVPDEPAHRALADGPAWRTPAGRSYGRSTLESAADVTRLIETLSEFRGADGIPPVWQANTVMATPDFGRLVPPRFECDGLPLVHYPAFPPRWQRPGLGDAVARGIEAGVWWPELHGLVHLPQAAWLKALRQGESDARRGHEQQCLVCSAVEGSGEFDPREPREVRRRSLTLAIERFQAGFDRLPGSLCPPDYRWDETLEADGESLGLTTFQGKAEQMGRPLPRLRHWVHRYRWPDHRGPRFYLPPRIAFEPRGRRAPDHRLGAAATRDAVRAAWGREQPAIVSSHRLNYAHLDAAWVETGRDALRMLLEGLADDGAVFLTDAEVRALSERGWSLRAIGRRGVLLRHHGAERVRMRFPAPAGVERVIVRGSRGSGEIRVAIEGGKVAMQVDPGAYRLEWERG